MPDLWHDPLFLAALKKGASGGTASGDIATFNAPKAAPLRSLLVNIDPVQEGTGDPSPDNVRPISGWSEVNVWVKPTYDPTADPTVTIQLGQTVYGGTLDVKNGVLTVDRAMKVFNGASSEGWTKLEYNYFVTSKISDAINRVNIPSDFQSNLFPYGAITNGSSVLGACLIWGQVRVRIADMSISVDDWKDLLAAQPMQVVYQLATPLEIPLTPQEISTLQGANNLWADTGDVTVEYLACGGENADLMKLAVAFMGRR